MNWKEVLQRRTKAVVVQSYGYTVKSVFNRHFEPFAHKREITFKVDYAVPMLYNPSFYLEDLEEELEFTVDHNNRVILDDPDIWSRD